MFYTFSKYEPQFRTFHYILWLLQRIWINIEQLTYEDWKKKFVVSEKEYRFYKIKELSSEPFSFKSICFRVIFTMFPFPFALLHQQTNLPNLKFSYTHLCKNTKKNKIHPMMMEVKGTKKIWVNSVCNTKCTAIYGQVRYKAVSLLILHDLKRDNSKASSQRSQNN